MQKALKRQKALNPVKLKFLPPSDSLSKFCKFSFHKFIKTTIVVHMQYIFKHNSCRKVDDCAIGYEYN